MGLFNPVPTASDVAAALAPDSAPPPVGTASVIGSATKFSLQDHTHQSSLQRAKATTNGSGVAAVTWGAAFSGAPVLAITVEDASAGRYGATILSNTTTACSIQIAKARLLPAALVLLSDLLNYDVFQAAGSGLTVHVVGGAATQ